MSAAPRGVTANRRSSATTLGLRFVIASSARSASTSVKASTSPLIAPARSLRPGRKSFGPMTIVKASVTIVKPSLTALQLIIETSLVAQSAAMSHPPYRDVTVGSLLTFLSRALPAHDALVYAGGPRFSFATLEREARIIARGLIALGVAPGERVVLWATNVPEWVILQFALAKIGAILVTANTSLRTRDIDYLLRQSDAATLITIRGFRDVDYINELASITERVATLERRIFIGDGTPEGFTPHAALRAAADRVSDETLDARGRAVGLDD